jgi:hypothetical protein
MQFSNLQATSFEYTEVRNAWSAAVPFAVPKPNSSKAGYDPRHWMKSKTS